MRALTTPDRHVLVGYDGSPAAEHALRWAMEEARLRDLPLTICHAWHWPYPFRPHDEQALGSVRDMGQMILDSAVVTASKLADDLEIRPLSAKGLPAAVLLDAAQDAELIVIGSRGHGGQGLTIGSCAAQVPAHAACPVVVVRPVPAEHRDPFHIVVGMDGSAAAMQALEFARQEAEARGGSVRAVCCWWDPGALPGFDLAPFTDPEAARRSARIRFERAIEPLQRRFPSVEVETEFTVEMPSRGLVQAARDASLLVVGDRGLASVPRMLLGPVTQAVLHEAACPVAVTHAAAPEAPEAGPGDRP